MNSILSDSQKTEHKRSWKWWQNSTNSTAKSPSNMICSRELEGDHIKHHGLDCSSSIAQSSLVVHHSVHSKESEDIASTASIKSKPWVSRKLKQSTIVSQDDEDEDDQNTIGTTQSINKIETNGTNIKSRERETPPASLINAAPSITSSTIPVLDYNPEAQQPRRKSLETAALFSGIKAKLGKWVNRTDNTKD
ncbi:hypothetical protein [Parasitella parasitica]|uniref:Uncharacterized protein n=1 Tax=Parasitella parasitica TaxID=35722 RepID=A0A0B7NGI7_9FUNG|nr:hypothetical protein [Parasitella parasitica]